MKTILVLTDFSANADNAAEYALKFAQKIEASLLLCNMYIRPANDNNPDPDAWPVSMHEEKSISGLADLLAHLKTEIDASDENTYHPDISQCSEEGLVSEIINDIAANKDILMAVISAHNADHLDTIFTRNHTREIIEKANFPVLIVPNQAVYKDYETIAFATDMEETDINVLRSLGTLAKHSDSDILITSIFNDGETVKKDEDAIKKLFEEHLIKITDSNILYKAIKSSSVGESLRLLSQHVDIDMVVLVQRKQSLFIQFTKENVIAKMVDHPFKPLLIFPYSNTEEALPVF